MFSNPLSLRELTEQVILQQVAPSAALVNGAGDLLYLHGRTGRYLEPAPGEVGVSNILKMAREGLQRDLTTALHRVVESREIVRCSGLRVKTNGDFATVHLTLRPVELAVAATPLYLIFLEEVLPAAGPLPPTVTPDAKVAEPEAGIAALRQELQAKDEYLQSTHEELETANEELKSANEEMQSVNEELQSTNEELETSKEELQSVNEELATVNAELQTKVAGLSQANNDLNNLLAGTGIGTVFVDLQLRILRFTPSATPIINLILSDVGRPVAHIVSNLVDYDRLVADIQAVLDSLVPHEREVQTQAGGWYTLRIQPYRTLENVIEGAVITFVDITEMVQTREALRKADDLLRQSVGAGGARHAIAIQNPEIGYDPPA
jgi:two-component system CheB/CheR fusion protein